MIDNHASVPILETRKLTKRFGGLEAVSKVDLTVKDREIVGLIGPNGAGKTTLFKMITGFSRPTSGQVRLRGLDITRFTPDERARRGVVCTFQRTAIFGGVKVFEAVRMGQHRITHSNILDAVTGTARHNRDERETVERGLKILKLVGLERQSDAIAGNLSYGQQRLVELAIALGARPDLLLLDEPAAGLNPTESAELSRVLLKIRELGTAILLVEHDMSVAMTICDRIVVIDSGHKIADCLPAEIRSNAAVIKAYLGEPDVAG